jgi:hypothetical protein
VEIFRPIYVRVVSRILGVLLFCAVGVNAAALDAPWPQTAIMYESSPAAYYWQAEPAGENAQLLTLFCGSCGPASDGRRDLPLVAVLRDTLGDENNGNDRVTYVWLLSYSRPTIGQRLLSAIPFFYWHVGRGSSHVGKRDIKPFFNLSTPRHPVLTQVGRDILQYTTFDPMIMPIRATSRAYRTNEVNHERLHLEEAISYLRQAPNSDGAEELSNAEVHTVIARLELRKKLLGGLVSAHRATKLGETASFEQERNRSRNWELLRNSAERTGLQFEPAALAGTTDVYAVLWFPLTPGREPSGSDLGPVWKLLGIKNPWRDSRVAAIASGTAQDRIPLAFYSLNYPNQPLLLVDFRDKSRTRRHEMTQRTINEITSGIIGISHFANWYYYVAADLYDFVASRHGKAMNQAERLDCYAQFRVSLALDRELDPQLRKELQQRVESLSLNPLETATAREMASSQQRYSLLEAEAQRPDGWLAQRLDNDRRAELSSAGRNGKSRFFAGALHVASLGLYTKRAPRAEGNLAKLDSYRRVEYDLNFLDGLVATGTPPEIVYQSERIQSVVTELTRLLSQVPSAPARARAQYALSQLRDLSQDAALQADCSSAIASIEHPLAGQHVAAVAEVMTEDRQ